MMPLSAEFELQQPEVVPDFADERAQPADERRVSK